jgi:hypothetical protein
VNSQDEALSACSVQSEIIVVTVVVSQMVEESVLVEKELLELALAELLTLSGSENTA